VFVGSGLKDTAGNIINDISIKKTNELAERFFSIEFKPDEQKYFLMDLENGTGTFAKIDNRLKIKSGIIVSFGDTHMLITIQENDGLEIKFIDGPRFEEIMHYTPEDTEISIGRMPDCTIKFDDNSLSRY
jgi:hypothetical protein